MPVALTPGSLTQSAATLPGSTTYTSADPAAASTGEAWLAPGETASSVWLSASQSQTMSSTAAPPQQGGSSSGWAPLAQGAGDGDAEWVWQVRAGKKHSYWATVADDCARILEHAYQNQLDSTTWDWDGWLYYYEMSTMMQTSPGEGTERRIRRIHRSQVDDDDAW